MKKGNSYGATLFKCSNIQESFRNSDTSSHASNTLRLYFKSNAYFNMVNMHFISLVFWSTLSVI